MQKIEISVNEKSKTLYWANAKFLPLEELENKDSYSSLLYHYSKEDMIKIAKNTNDQNFIDIIKHIMLKINILKFKYLFFISLLLNASSI